MSFDGMYLDWNQKRIKLIVEHYGHNFFVHKRILDLGCGYGDISGVLHRLGGDITAVDARQEHLKIISKKYVGVKTVKADLDKAWPFFGKSFDLTLDMGLLYLLNNCEEHLKAVCASTNFLIIETAVLDSNDPDACLVKPDVKGSWEGSFNGFCTQASPAFIERILKANGMSFKRMDNTKFNSGPYSYDWPAKNDGSFDVNKRRIWFCTRDAQLVQQTVISTQPVIALPTLSNKAFSPNLIDSKIPVNHKHIKTTQSPTLPRGPDQVRPPQTVVPGNQVNKIRVFYNYYIDKNPQRRREIDFCLQKNIENKYIDLIMIESESNPTFDFMFEKINRLSGPNDINIICSADIFFDDSVAMVHRLGAKDIYALSPWDWKSAQTIIAPNTDQNQDVWVMRGKVQGVNGNFPLGKPASDNRIAYEFRQAGYNISNPSKSIKTYHYHNSGIKNSTPADTVLGEHFYVGLTSL